MKVITAHPASIELHRTSSLHPLMTDSEFTSLVDDIGLNGQLEPIKLYRGKVVDGRHRLKAALELGLDFIKCVELPNNTTIEELRTIVMMTEQRRHQTTSQRACTAYLDLLSCAKGTTTQAVQARTYGINKALLSKCKKVNDVLGTNVIKQLADGKVTTVLVNGHYIKYTCVSRLYNDLMRKAEHEETKKTLADLRVNYTQIDIEVRSAQGRKTKEEIEYYLKSWINHMTPGE